MITLFEPNCLNMPNIHAPVKEINKKRSGCDNVPCFTDDVRQAILERDLSLRQFR